MTLPSASAIGKAVLMTAVAVVIINIARPYLPAQVQNLLKLS